MTRHQLKVRRSVQEVWTEGIAEGDRPELKDDFAILVLIRA